MNITARLFKSFTNSLVHYAMYMYLQLRQQCICIHTCNFSTICFVHNNKVHQKPQSPRSIYNTQSIVIYLHTIGGIAKVNRLHTNHTCSCKAKHKIINKMKSTITLYNWSIWEMTHIASTTSGRKKAYVT